MLNLQKREIDLNSNKGNANEWEIWGIRKSINLLCSTFNQAIKICSFFLITQFN